MQNKLTKLQQLRQLLKQHKIDGYLVPHNDAHNSEYLQNEDERVAFISGFKGSNALCFITQDNALCWTDGRYFIQCQKELDREWQMKKMIQGESLWHEYLLNFLKPKFKIGYDPQLMNAETEKQRSADFKRNNIELIPIQPNLIDLIWKKKANQKSHTNNSLFIHDTKWNNYPSFVKLEEIGIDAYRNLCSGIIFSKLDEIAWILNLRGNDINYNPLFKSYLFVYLDCLNDYDDDDHFVVKFNLYIDESKINLGISQYIKSLNGSIKPYDSVFQDLNAFQEKIGVVRSNTNCKIVQSIRNDKIVYLDRNEIEFRKSIKTPTEIQGLKQCLIRDATAVISYFAFLENELINNNNQNINEYEGAVILNEKRMRLENNVGISFETISCTGMNSAIIHYTPEKDKSNLILPQQIYLVDSGGQYHDGTTDITRTLHFATPTQEEREAYTKVLLGNLDIQRIHWPQLWKISGSDLDILGRKHLWMSNMNYEHGTGHGVGFFLNVHEPVCGIGKGYKQPLVPGNVLTDEPGYYCEGKFGIRIEDQLLVVEKGTGYYGFENLTMCPYDTNLIDTKLLTQDTVDYINEYHRKVWEQVSPLLKQQNDDLALNWLQRKTAQIYL